MSTRLFVPLALALSVAPAAPAQAPKPTPDVADFFPADVLAYAEVSRPALVAGELKALAKGSVLDDILPHLDKIRERQNPKLLQNQSRVRRIARGSGSTPQEVQKFIKQFNEMQKMMRQMGKGGGMPRMQGLPGRR